jgi:hypothetical protein
MTNLLSRDLLSGTTGMNPTRGEELGPRSPQDRSADQDPIQPQRRTADGSSSETAEQRKERRRRLEMVLRALI